MKVCGVTDYPDKVGVKIQAETIIKDGILKIEMGGLLEQDNCIDASWAIESI